MAESWLVMPVIVGAHEAPYTRHPPAERDTESYLVEACSGRRGCWGRAPSVDGLGVGSFSLAPDHAIDLAWRLGLSLRWVMEDPHGGAGGLNMLQHALRALEAGDAETIVLCAGDRLDRDAFRTLVETTTARPPSISRRSDSAARTPCSRSSPNGTRGRTASTRRSRLLPRPARLGGQPGAATASR